jgi:hypothetical protein
VTHVDHTSSRVVWSTSCKSPRLPNSSLSAVLEIPHFSFPLTAASHLDLTLTHFPFNFFPIFGFCPRHLQGSGTFSLAWSCSALFSISLSYPFGVHPWPRCLLSSFLFSFSDLHSRLVFPALGPDTPPHSSTSCIPPLLVFVSYCVCYFSLLMSNSHKR